MSSTPSKLRTSDLPRSLPSTAPMSSNLHDSLSTALLESNSIPTIEKRLAQSLAEAGWTTELRIYIQRLVRNGEAGNYQAILKRVLAEVRASPGSDDKGKEAPGDSATAASASASAIGTGDLKIPEKVVRDGVRVVRKELERVVTVLVDD